jgi:hypothetical protein
MLIASGGWAALVVLASLLAPLVAVVVAVVGERQVCRVLVGGVDGVSGTP